MAKKDKKVKKAKISKFEKLIYVVAAIMAVLSPVSIVFSKATLSEVNYKVEQKKTLIEKQEKNNNSLAMTIDELASLSKVQQVAQDEGLSYNNANIKVVQDK